MIFLQLRCLPTDTYPPCEPRRVQNKEGPHFTNGRLRQRFSSTLRCRICGGAAILRWTAAGFSDYPVESLDYQWIGSNCIYKCCVCIYIIYIYIQEVYFLGNLFFCVFGCFFGFCLEKERPGRKEGRKEQEGRDEQEGRKERAAPRGL